MMLTFALPYPPFWPTAWPLFWLLPTLVPLPVIEAEPTVPVGFTPRLVPRKRAVAPPLRLNIEVAVEFTATVKGFPFTVSGVRVITDPPL